MKYKPENIASVIRQFRYYFPHLYEGCVEVIGKLLKKNTIDNKFEQIIHERLNRCHRK